MFREFFVEFWKGDGYTATRIVQAHPVSTKRKMTRAAGISAGRKHSNMQEILTAVTYLVVWLLCERVIGIESGLVNLIISLGAAVGVYVFIAVRAHRKKKETGEE